jgi:hypothetical protein
VTVLPVRKKPNSDFYKLLQEQIDKVNPHHRKPANKKRKVSALEVIEARLKHKENVKIVNYNVCNHPFS